MNTEANTIDATSSSERIEANEWLKERKRELDALLEKKSAELSKKAQSHFARKVGNYESALQAASESLDENEENQCAQAMSKAAEQARNAKRYLETKDSKEIIDDAANFVRRNPLPLLAVGLLAGVFIGKVAKTSKDL